MNTQSDSHPSWLSLWIFCHAGPWFMYPCTMKLKKWRGGFQNTWLHCCSCCRVPKISPPSAAVSLWERPQVAASSLHFFRIPDLVELNLVTRLHSHVTHFSLEIWTGPFKCSLCKCQYVYFSPPHQGGNPREGREHSLYFLETTTTVLMCNALYRVNCLMLSYYFRLIAIHMQPELNPF